MTKGRLLRKICSLILAVSLVVGSFSGIVYAGNGGGTGTSDGSGGNNGHKTDGFATGAFNAYKVTFFKECYPLDPVYLRNTDIDGGVWKFNTFWVNFYSDEVQNCTGGLGTQLGHYGMADSAVQHNFNVAMEDWNNSFTFFIASSSETKSQGNMGTQSKFYSNNKATIRYPVSSSMRIATDSDWGSSEFNIVDFDDKIKGDSFWNCNSFSDFINDGNTSLEVGLNRFSSPDTKLEAYSRLLDIAGLSAPIDIDDFGKYGIVIVQKCMIAGAPVDVDASGFGDVNKEKRLFCYTWHDCVKSVGSVDSRSLKSLIPGSGNGERLMDSGRFYMNQYAPIIEVGFLKPLNSDPEPYTCVSGFGLWGLTTVDKAGTATNTLVVYNAEPVTGGTADAGKWEIYSTIVDGKMPDTADGDCQELNYWDKTDWKKAGSFLEAIDGKSSDTLQNIDNGEYAMIARDSYRNVAVPSYLSVLFSNVVANNDKAQEATKLLEKAPETVVWGAKTVQALTGSSDSFGDVLTIATLNGVPFANDTSGYAQTPTGLQMVGGVRKAGTLTNDKILDQVNSEIKSALSQASTGNWTGTGVGAHFKTDTSALGSAVEIVVKGKPVESDLHVVTVFDGVATLTPNVKNYKYTNVNYGIVDPQLDSGMSDQVQAVILVPKDGSPTGDSIVSSMTGTTPDNAVSTFTSLSPDNREGAPVINVGNKEDKGYDIYVLIFSEPPTPVEGAVELPDYLLNLYYNRVWYYTTKGTEYKVKWDRFTYPHLNGSGDTVDGATGGTEEASDKAKTCYYSTHEFSPICGGTLANKTGDHKDCKKFFTQSQLNSTKDTLHKYWTVSYKDVSPDGSSDGGNNSSAKFERDSGRLNVYYLRASFVEANTTQYIWDKSQPSKLGNDWFRQGSANADGSLTIGDTDAAVDTHADATLPKHGDSIIFDYAYNLTRASSKDNRTLSAIGYEGISKAPSVNGVENFLKLKFGDKPDSPLSVGTERSSDAKVTDYTQEIVFNSAFSWEYGTTAGDNSENTGNAIQAGSALRYPTGTACRVCNGGEAEVPEQKTSTQNPDGTTTETVTQEHKDAVDCDDGATGGHAGTYEHCPHCGASPGHAGTSDDHATWGNFVCSEVSGGSEVRQVNTTGEKVLGFTTHFGTGDDASKISQNFEQYVYKYQTGSMPTGQNSKLGQNSTSKRATVRQGDISNSNSYRMAFNYGSTAPALKYYPEVKMGYYKNDGDVLVGAAIANTYKGRNLLDSNKTEKDDGAAFEVAHDTLYTMGEKERSVKPSSLYLYRIKSGGGESVHGNTTSDSTLSSSHSSGSLSKVTIPAGTDMTMKATPDNLKLNLYGYALDIIKTSDTGKLVGAGSSYNDYVKSGMAVYTDWGNSEGSYTPSTEFNNWANIMTATKNYNADAILNVDNKRAYNNFTASFGGFTGGTNEPEKVYVLQVEHGQIQNKLGYPALISQIAEDYKCSSSEAKALFEASGIPQSIIDSLEHDTASVNKSDGKNNVDGFKVYNSFDLGSSAHWYDEMTRTFVIRRFAKTDIGIKDVVLQDKLDLGDSANSNYGSRTNRSNNNRQYGNDKTIDANWYVSIFFAPSSLGGSGAIKTNLLTTSPSPYKPSSNSGIKLSDLIDGQNSYRESGVMVICNAPVHNADFLVPSSTTSNFGD